MHLEEDALLAKLIELGIAVKKAGGDELIEDSHDERWKDGEEDIVKGERPGFVNNLSGEAVLERVLNLVRQQ
jgi:NADPH:quinone reductase-like Zn-dependent oxidoreductase